MKKFILIDNQVAKLNPFRHFHDLINLQVNESNVGGLGFDDIKQYQQETKLFRHNEYNAPFYLDVDDYGASINSWQGNKIEIPIDILTDKAHDPDTNRNWISACWISPTAKDDIKDVVYVYRKSSDMKLYNVLTDQLINDGKTVISNTLFLLHAEWPGTPLYHVLLNDNLVFWTVQTINNENYFVDTVSYHDGTFNEYVLKPRSYGCFIQDSVVISPRSTFKIDFYGRSRFGLQNKDFPFDTLKLKIKSNIKHKKLDVGTYEFDLENKQTGYLYARINAGYGAEVEPSTAMRLAYTVHKS